MSVEIHMTKEASAQPLSWDETELGPREASKYRADAALLNYLALDRPDILFASGDCSRRMSDPRNGDWARIKRVVRFILGKPRLVWKFLWQDALKLVSASSDSNLRRCQFSDWRCKPRGAGEDSPPRHPVTLAAAGTPEALAGLGKGARH